MTKVLNYQEDINDATKTTTTTTKFAVLRGLAGGCGD